MHSPQARRCGSVGPGTLSTQNQKSKNDCPSEVRMYKLGPRRRARPVGTRKNLQMAGKRTEKHSQLSQQILNLINLVLQCFAEKRCPSESKRLTELCSPKSTKVVVKSCDHVHADLDSKLQFQSLACIENLDRHGPNLQALYAGSGCRFTHQPGWLRSTPFNQLGSEIQKNGKLLRLRPRATQTTVYVMEGAGALRSHCHVETHHTTCGPHQGLQSVFIDFLHEGAPPSHASEVPL